VSHGEILESELRSFEIDLPSPQKVKLAAYCDELARWNQKINLTGLSGSNLVRRLVIEPVWIGQQLKPHGILADIGSGNGSPAIPLHVVCNFQFCHLIEARSKRAAFLRHVLAAIEVERTEIHRARFEDAAPLLRGVDWITLQGVALEPQLIRSIQEVAGSTTTIVWITATGARTSWKASRTLRIPFTSTHVSLFRMDLS
jgi:16S rRNA (guanine(527)-N(7))-methyltransferase RsmG